MKLCYVTNSRLPTEKAHGIQIMKTCEALAKQGVKLELIVPSRKNPLGSDLDPFIFYGVKPLFTFTTVPTFDPTFLLKLPQGFYIQIQSRLFRRSLRRFFRNRDSQSETVFYTRDEYLLPVLLHFFPKVVWEGHTFSQRTTNHIKYLKRCLKIIVISQGLKQHLTEHGIVAEKISVAPDGVDLEDFTNPPEPTEAKIKLGLPQNKRLVVYTGHLYDWKGAAILAEAAALLSPDAMVVFVGGTEFDLPLFQKRFARVSNILITGHKPYKQIPLYLAAADVLVLPNSAKTEISRLFTSPLKLFEYMAARRPIVASDLPSVREVIDESCAVFAIPDDPQSFGEGISRVLTDPVLARSLTVRAWNKVQSFTWQQRARTILSHLA